MFSKIRMVLFRSLLESLGNVGASEEPIPSRRAHFLRSNLMDMVEELKSVENEKGFILVASVPASEVNSALENLQREVNNFVKINNSFDSCRLIKFINKYEWCKHIYHRDFLFYGDQCVRSPHGEFLFYGNNAYASWRVLILCQLVTNFYKKCERWKEIFHIPSFPFTHTYNHREQSFLISLNFIYRKLISLECLIFNVLNILISIFFY